MAEMKAQSYLQTYYASAPSSAATTRGASPATSEIRYAEAFQRVLPQVVTAL